MIAELPVNVDLTNPSMLLYGGITTLAGVVILLWKMVIARNTRCEEENKKMAENILVLTQKVGQISGQHMAICAMLRGCSVPGCTLSKSKLLDSDE